MRKRIHLTESQLHRLVEQALNEISIETKMSAARKAARELEDYRDQAHDMSSSRLKRKYARDMAGKRLRQMNTFINGVNSDAEKGYRVGKASYNPDPRHSHTRGILVADEPVFYGSTDTDVVYSGAESPDRKRWEDYLRGNSYYENGKWKRPVYSRDYDIAKSEPWSEIRSRSNEAVAHRVTESIMRKLRRM